MADEKDRRYRASLEIAASPWDVYEALLDDDTQRQWRDRFSQVAPIADQQPYTRIAYTDGLTLELEPQDGGTLLTAIRARSTNGMTGRIGRWMTSRKSVEEELLTELKRIQSAIQFGDL